MNKEKHQTTVLDRALRFLRGVAQDADKRITVHPNGANNTGRPALIDGETCEVKAGMGGKFNGRNIDDIPRGKNPHAVTEEKYQARQERVAQKQQAATAAQTSATPAPQATTPVEAAPVTSGIEAMPKTETRQIGNASLDFGEVMIARNGNTYRMAEPTEEFWNEWRANKSGLKEQGYGAFKADNGKFYVTYYDGGKATEQEIEQRQKADFEKKRNAVLSALEEYEDDMPRKEYNRYKKIIESAQKEDDLYGINETETIDEILSDLKSGELSDYFSRIGSGSSQATQGGGRANFVHNPNSKFEAGSFNDFRFGDFEDARVSPNGKWIDSPSRTSSDGNKAIVKMNPDNLKMTQYGYALPINEEQVVYLKDWQVGDAYDGQKEVLLMRQNFIPNKVRDVPGGEKAKTFDDYLSVAKSQEGECPNKAGNVKFRLRDTKSTRAEKEDKRGVVYASSYGGGRRWSRDEALAIDAAASVREKDENGYLHVKTSHITKATVNPYYGREIPGWQEAGLEPDKIYYGLRDPEELKKSLPTWSGLPIHIEHHIDSADDPQKLTRVGNVGTEIVWNDPYVDAPLTILDSEAIAGIEDGTFRELSCAYRYTPDFEPGEYHGQPYDFVMRDIRGNHVALVEEGRAGHDVLVADSALNTQSSMQKFKEYAKMKFNKWLRGATDAAPDAETEQKEVDLAQAIIDLHKTNPLTGKVEDVAEDADKEAELKVLVEGLKSKLAPEDYEKLIGAVKAFAVATDMCAEGKDADPAEFAEGVKYGEELEKDPAEREKLDSEHESEGAKKALDECGGVAKDEDKNAIIEKIIKAVPDLTEEQIAQMRDTLSDLAYSPATGDEEISEKVEAAADRAIKRGGFLGAKDAATIRKQATAEAMQTLRAINDAVRRVRPLIGEVDAMSFDSAGNVYGYALEQLGINPRQYDRAAWRGMVDVLLSERYTASGTPKLMASDSKAIPQSGPFANLNKISLAN